MKIYKSNHVIETVDKVNDLIHIPLCYMSLPEEKEVDVQLDVMQDYSEEYRKMVMPYTIYEHSTPVLFDNNEQVLNPLKLLHRQNNSNNYYLMPTSHTIEESTRFSYNIKIKKQKEYVSGKDYHISVGCIDKDNNLELSKKLISIFSDAYVRSVAPSNVIINSGDLSVQSLSNKSLDEIDFLFIESPDGEKYHNGERIDFKSFEEKNINVWIVLDEHNLLVEEDHEDIFIISDIATERATFKIDKKFRNNEHISSTEEFEDVSLFSEYEYQVLVRDKFSKHFLLKSHNSFSKYISENARAIYELILYTHLNGYKTSRTIHSFINDVIPDYHFAANGNVTTPSKYEEQIDFHTLFKIDQEECTVIDIDITPKELGITYSNIEKDKILFSPKDGFKKKEDESVVVSIHNGNIVNYSKNNSVYEKSKPPALVGYSLKDREITIELSNFVNSKKGIKVDDNIKLTAPINSRTENTLRLFVYNDNGRLLVKSYKDKDLKELICIVKVSFDSSNIVEIYDIRKEGGGLSEKEEDNFNLLDISSSQGRPFRRGGTLLIYIPKEFKEYDEIIQSRINEHKVAGTYHLIKYV